MAVQDLERIEQKIDRAAAGAIAISDNVGGVMFASMSELLEFAKLMSISQTAVPKHLRGNPGSCLAVCVQALEWRMSPFSVANQSYEVNDRIAYQSMLIHAVVEARSPLKQRLRPTYTGEGQDRACKITGHIKGEVDPLEYESPTVGKIKVKNSPLWTSDVVQQLFYYASRAWARRYCPDVLLGIYSADELDQVEALDVTPAKPDIATRLKKTEGSRGFAGDNVDRALEHKPTVQVDIGTGKQPEPVTIDNSSPIADAQMELSAGDVETELSAKKQALDRVETKADLLAIVASVTDFLKTNKRTDLLGDFMSHADRRGKRLKDAA